MSRFCIAWSDTGNVTAGAAVYKEMLHCIGKEPVFPILIFRQITAKLPLKICKIGYKLRNSFRRAPLCKADKSGRTCTNAFHRFAA